MPSETHTPSAIEQAVSRALRDNLERIQRTSDELHQAIADVVAACGSTKPVNALAPMLRAQTSAASLSASLEVLSRFVAVSLQPGPRSPFEAEIARIASTIPTAETVPRGARLHSPAGRTRVDPAARSGAGGTCRPCQWPKSITPQKAEPSVAPPTVKDHHAAAPEPHSELPVAEAHEIEAPPPAAGESEDAGTFDVSRSVCRRTRTAPPRK